MRYIHNIRKLDPGIGSTKLWYMYRNEFPDNERVGRDWFEDILCRHHLKVRDKMRRPKTTDSTHGLPFYPNLAHDFIPGSTNELWASNITYIPVWLDEVNYVFCYLTLILDGYSHEIIGWSVGDSLETRHSIAALSMALKRLEGVSKEKVGKLIHHSDRGVQYASKEYIDKLKDRHIRISMIENGDPKKMHRQNGQIPR